MLPYWVKEKVRMGWLRYIPVTPPWALQFIDLEQEWAGDRKWTRAQNGSDEAEEVIFRSHQQQRERHEGMRHTCWTAVYLTVYE